MSVAEDTTQVPTTIAKIDVDDTAVLVAAVVNDLTSTISNTLEAPLKLVSETPKLVESATKAIVDKSEAVVEKGTKIVEQTTKDILKESQSVIDETTKLIDNITSVIAGKNDLIMNASTNIIADEATKAIMSEGQAIVDETTKLVAKTAENIANMVSEEEKRLTETISRLSIDMEQEAKKASGLFTKIHNFVKLIMSCIHRADKSVVKVSTADVDIKVANVV
jgi:NAD dependent epimerase/dehydratase family enzyme